MAHQAGVVADLLVDPIAGCLASLSVQHSDGWQVERIPASYVHRLGPHAVIVADAVDLAFEEPRVSDASWVSLDRLLGMEVLTEGGDRLGRISDVQVDPETLAVTSFELSDQPSGNPLRHRDRVRPHEVVSYSDEMLIVEDARQASRAAQAAGEAPPEPAAS